MRSVGRLPVHRKVALVGAAQLAILLLVVGVGLGGALSVERRVGGLTRQDVPASNLLFELERDAFQAQLALEQSFENDDLHVRDERLALYSRSFERLHVHWNAFGELAPDTPRSAPVWAQFESSWRQWAEVTLVVASLSRQNDSATDPETRGLIEQSRGHFARLSHDLSLLMREFQELVVARSLAEVHERTHALRLTLTGLLGLGLALGAFVMQLGVRATKKQQDEIERRDQDRQRQAQQRDFESRLHRALEMAQSEEAALEVVGRALAALAPEHPSELLLAEASRGRFRRAVATEPEGGRSGCPVPTPNDCAAVRRGYALSFASSRALDACPYLRERESQSCSAYCAPVTMGGATVGVLHAIGPEGGALEPDLCSALEHIAARAGERIGYIQAFHRSEAEAATDPLTGLLNRRSMQEQARALFQEGRPFAVGYGDLDRFKQLNDRHGHDVGDRALGLFARVLRDSLKKSDLCARWGGEEFIVIFPGCRAAEGKRALDRVREALRSALTGATIPSFSVSFGVADSSDGVGLEELLTVADHALLAAKRGGRDQVVIAGEEPEEKPDDELGEFSEPA